MGLKLDLFSTIGLRGVIGSSDKSLKIDWVDKPCRKTRKKKKKNEMMRIHILMLAFKLSLFPIHNRQQLRKVKFYFSLCKR